MQSRGSAIEVFAAFLKLGLTSFGGPIAHIGYFRTEFVQRRRWLDDAAFSDLVALCQFLPGPASSQVGMALGLGRAGWWGALAAWSAFTLPSAGLLILFALGVASQPALAASGALHGLQVVAVAVVAQAVWGMSRTLCPDGTRAAIAAVVAALVLVFPAAWVQVAAVALAALLGGWVVKPALVPAAQGLDFGVSRRAAWIAGSLFVGLLAALPVWAALSGQALAALLAGVYRAGALVFGGGHVVLPLLEAAVVPAGFVSQGNFLAGYGAAQAVPGPLFTFAAYLGAAAHEPVSGWAGGLLLLVTIFIPAFLLVVAALPFWTALRARADAQSVIAGVNAGVVGLLAAALYDPLWLHAIGSMADLALALAAFGLLVFARASPVVVVAIGAVAGWLLA